MILKVIFKINIKINRKMQLNNNKLIIYNLN